MYRPARALPNRLGATWTCAVDVCTTRSRRTVHQKRSRALFGHLLLLSKATALVAQYVREKRMSQERSQCVFYCGKSALLRPFKQSPSAEPVERMGLATLDSNVWRNEEFCFSGTSYDNCCNQATFSVGKSITVCGEEPCRADGTTCLAGTTGGNVAIEYTTPTDRIVVKGHGPMVQLVL